MFYQFQWVAPSSAIEDFVNNSSAFTPSETLMIL